MERIIFWKLPRHDFLSELIELLIHFVRNPRIEKSCGQKKTNKHEWVIDKPYEANIEINLKS